MKELINTACLIGTYNNILTSLTSNNSVVNLVEMVTIDRKVNKKKWVDGDLVYTLSINNNMNDLCYDCYVINAINTDLIYFVDNSVTINGVSASSDQYSCLNNSLKINLNDIPGNSNTIVTFSVRKKYDGFYILKDNCELFYNGGYKSESNYLSVLSPAKRRKSKYCNCNAFYWR